MCHQNNEFAKIISLLDHGWLVASLHATALYMDPIDAGLASQIRTALTNFNMSMWMSTNGLSMMYGRAGKPTPRGGCVWTASFRRGGLPR